VLQSPQNFDSKALPPKPKSMQASTPPALQHRQSHPLRANGAQADGQRKELQRITADNKRLYRSLQV
jgi:hypothetical protein